MFLNTVGISERQIRTALSKTNSYGMVESEKRGGVDKIRAELAKIMKQGVGDHINRFPRTESHYCRKNNNRQYLAEDLTVRRMYEMYCSE